MELRLNELWDVVDVFVIVEARESFTGNPKPICISQHKDRLSKYMQKIRHVVVDSFPKGLDGWGHEAYQRNYMINGLSDLQSNDVIIFSDLDEIPRAKVVQRIVSDGIRSGEVYCLSLDWYSFYLNIKLKERWERQGPRLIRADDLKTFIALRWVKAPTKGFGRNLVRQIKASWHMGKWLRRILVRDAGWHFTWMGGNEAVALKGGSIPAQSKIPLGDKSLDWADARLNRLLNNSAGYERVDIDESYPKFLRNNPKVFEKHILQ